MILETVQTIWNFIQNLVSTVLTVDRVFYIGVGFALLMILFFSVKSMRSYEIRLVKTVDKLNNWLNKHRNITSSNLIEFNNIIKDKKAPKILRKHWQQYMLYRDKMPSEYMSAANCIDKPSKTSSFTSDIKNFNLIMRFTATITLFLNLIYYAAKSDTVIACISLSLLTPVTILFVAMIATLIFRFTQNNNLASLYQTFHIFTRSIDNASVTIPKYVDFEVLFTQKEIKEGIPVLGEYLEKRARQEQEELEEAQRNAVSHEEYDFASSGIDGSLVLERAMKESETYINAKQRLLAEIQQFEVEITTLSRNYENTSKDFQRKLQASKENMERLRQQQEESTNRIEVNYIRKQQQDEVRKQEQLEKDLDDTTNKYNTEVKSLNEEIEKRRAMIEERRVKVEEAMNSEYQTFAGKLHSVIEADIKKTADDDIQKISTEKDQYAQAIAYLKTETDNKDEIIKAKDQTIAELQKRIEDLTNMGNGKAYVATNEPEEVVGQEEVETSGDDGEEGYYDEKGYYWFKDGTYYDADTNYHDLEGNVFDGEGNLIAEGQPVEEPQKNAMQEDVDVEPTADDTVNEQAQNIDEEVDNFEVNNEEAIPEETEEQSPVNEEQVAEEQQTQTAGGHYDDRGYFWYDDKTYYDNTGRYHDLYGNVYESDGTLVAENQPVETENKQMVENPAQEQKVGSQKSNDENALEEQPKEENEQEKEVEATEEIAAEKPQEEQKRKVGRPRKEKLAEEDTPKRSVGRPRKEKADEDDNKPKRKVGRPKKENGTVKPKGKVGRPKNSAGKRKLSRQ